ncbi:MAG: hypothetical protein ABIG89_00575 [Candidatus Woesearchaeota archaeon]
MIPVERVNDHMDRLTRKRPDEVREKLKLRDRIPYNQHTLHLLYEIDDLSVTDRLRDLNNDLTLHREIHQLFCNKEKNFAVFDEVEEDSEGQKVVPFTRALETAKGLCLEYSIMLQLAKQQITDSYLVAGLLMHPDVKGRFPHEYNVVMYDGKPCLVDALNVLIDKSSGKKVIRPYVVPIIGMELKPLVGLNGNHKAEHFVLEEKYAGNRTYTLSLDKQHQRKTPSIFELL